MRNAAQLRDAGPASRDSRVTVGFVAVTAAYCLGHVAIRLLAPGSVEHDEAEQLVLGQVLALGYGIQPPLYTWIQHAVFQTVGVGVFALALVKQGLLFATYLFCFLAARHMLEDARLAALAALSLWLIPQIGWEAQRDLSHSVLATALAAALVCVVVRLAEGPRTGLYVVAGLLIALGVLSKYSFGVFAAALLIAAASLEEFRSVLLHARLGLSLAVAAVVVAPHLVWVAGDPRVVTVDMAAKLRLLDTWSVGAATRGLWELAWSVTRFVGPLVVVAAVLAPGALRRPRDRGGPRYRLLLERLLLVELALLAVGGAGLGLVEFKTRWLQPLLWVVALPLALRIRGTRPSLRRLRAFAVIVAAVGILWLMAQLGAVWIGPWVGRYSRLHLPMRELAGQLRAAGFQRGTIVAGDRVLAGSLRLGFPDSRVLTPELPYLILPPPTTPGSCLAVWRPRQGPAPSDSLMRFVADQLGAALPADRAYALIQTVPLGLGARPYRLVFALLEGERLPSRC
jgi:4-amino-4-deoxy-L-arabinose transferase-like glycosyltransferase